MNEQQDVVKDIRDFKRRLIVETNHDIGIRLFAIAISRSDDNEDLKIPTFYGDPICQEAHDLIRDCYYTCGVSFVDLGEIPISMCVTMEDICGWKMIVPVPSNVLRRYMSDDQKSEFSKWKQKFRSKDYYIKFMQIRNVY